MIHAVLDGQAAPVVRCYIHNARCYTLTLTRSTDVAERTIQVGRHRRIYRQLKEAHFQIDNPSTRERTYFQMLIGGSGSLRGVPLQITYQPNWWFEVILNLK